MKEPIYTLPHGIQVIGEYAPNRKFPYWRVRVRPHPLLVGKIVSNGIYMRRSKAIATAMLGRIIGRNEHVHHERDREDDRPEHLEVLSAAKHNQHHKIGTHHSEDAKERIGESVRKAYRDGRRAHQRYLRGSEQSQAKLDEGKVRLIRSSRMPARALAKQLGVSKQTVLSVRNHKTWKHIQ